MATLILPGAILIITIAPTQFQDDTIKINAKTALVVTRVTDRVAVAIMISDKSRAVLVIEEVPITACHHTGLKITTNRSALCMVRRIQNAVKKFILRARQHVPAVMKKSPLLRIVRLAMIEENGSTAFHQHLQITTIQKNASRTEGLTTIAALERGAVHAGLITSMSCKKINALELPITTIVCLNRHPKITFPQNVCTRIAALPGSSQNIAWIVSRKRAPKSTARIQTEIEQVCSDVYHQLLQNTMFKKSAWLTAKRAKIVALK